MEESQLSLALQAEYLHIQKTIEDFDARVLTIKAWSVKFGLAAVGGAFASHASVVFLVSAISACLFWYLETSWKIFQLAYYARSESIERHFSTKDKLKVSFKLAQRGRNEGKTWNARKFGR